MLLHEFLSHPDVQTVILGVVANTLTSVLAQVGGKVVKGAVTQPPLTEDKTLHSILQKAVRSLEDMGELEDGAGHTLIAFLQSQEMEMTARQLFTTQLTSGQYAKTIKELKAEFQASLALYSNLPEASLVRLSEGLFRMLMSSTEHALARAVDRDVLAGHEAFSAYRHRLLMDELKAVQKVLSYLSQNRDLNVNRINEFEQKYRDQVGSRYSTISPPFLDRDLRIPLENLYVSPGIVQVSPKATSAPFTLDELLRTSHRCVILGNPGGGKTTLVHKVAHMLTRHYAERLYGGRLLTPVVIVLRDFALKKSSADCSIEQYITAEAASRHQTLPPDAAFEYLLLNGRLLIIFDGLDELLDTSRRQDIRGDIESFCNMYPSTPVLVTSREVGYEQASLDESIFKAVRLTDFTVDQVQEYGSKWFALDRSLSTTEQDLKASTFMKESATVHDLRCNPLMLSLMCNLYKGEGYIPRNRPDLYEKCSTLLFEQWDRRRSIKYKLPFDQAISPAMRYLAHWIFSDETLQRGVPERQLIQKAADYLTPTRFEDRDEAERAAAEFIAFCRGRAWVFTEIGKAQDDQGLFQFTHRTFLEYFAADYLVRTHRTPDSLVSVLAPRLAKREWDVVAQLAFQIQAKKLEGAADELLTEILNAAFTSSGQSRSNLVSFAVRCLVFLVPSPRVVRQITLESLDQCITWGMQNPPQQDKRLPIGAMSHAVRNLRDLLNVSEENLGFVATCSEEFLNQRLMSASDGEARLVAELGFALSAALSGVEDADERVKYWQGVEERFSQGNCKHLIRLAPSTPIIASLLYWAGQCPIGDILKWYGPRGLFQRYRYTLFGMFVPGICEVLLGQLTTAEIPDDLADDLRQIGDLIIQAPAPWLSRSDEVSVRGSFVLSDLQPKHELDGDALFGAFVLLAPLLELMEEIAGLQDKLKAPTSATHRQFRTLFLRWLGEASEEELTQSLRELKFTTPQTEFVRTWASRSVSLVGTDTAKSARATSSHRLG